MLRKFMLTVGALMVASCSPQEPKKEVHEPLPTRPWTKVYTGKNSTIYLDKTDIQTAGGEVTAWELQDFNEIQKFNDSSYLSTVVQFNFKCDMREFRPVVSHFFADHMAKGEEAWDATDPIEYTKAPEKSYASHMLDAVCPAPETPTAPVVLKPAKLEVVDEDNERTIYADKGNIEAKGDNKTVWFVQDFKAIPGAPGDPYMRGSPPKDFRSLKYQVEYDCAGDRHRIETYGYYGQAMAKGSPKMTDPEGDWTPVPVAGADRKAMIMVCGAGRDRIDYDPQAALRERIKQDQLASMGQCVNQGAGALIQGGTKSRIAIEERLRGCENMVQASDAVSRPQVHSMYERMVEQAIDDFLASHEGSR